MLKRSNQESQPQSEPASKRIANRNENEICIIAEHKLLSARIALDRLDYKNSSRICTEVSNRVKAVQEQPTAKRGPFTCLSITHQGDLCKLIIEVASPCSSLKLLSSEMLGQEEGIPFLNNQSLTLQSSWSPSLRYIMWNGGAESLACDETLLKSLRSANRVFIHSTNVHLSWVVRLLSSASSTLVKLDFPRTKKKDVDEIPGMINLPKLVHLRIGRALRSRSSEDYLFKSLHAPKLRSLSVGAVSIKDLPFLFQDLHLDQLVAFGLDNVDPALTSEAIGEEEATSLVEVIKHWKKLRTLDLRLDGAVLPSFYTRLIDLLIPLSKDLPKFRRLSIGCEKSVATDTLISATGLVSLVRSRLEGSLSAGTTVPVRQLRINVPIKIDDETLSWLEENVALVQIKHRIA